MISPGRGLRAFKQAATSWCHQQEGERKSMAAPPPRIDAPALPSTPRDFAGAIARAEEVKGQSKTHDDDDDDDKWPW